MDQNDRIQQNKDGREHGATMVVIDKTDSDETGHDTVKSKWAKQRWNRTRSN